VISTPSKVLPGGILLADEPASIGANVFAGNGEVLIHFNFRPGGDLGQAIIGLRPDQALALLDGLGKHADFCRAAVAKGSKGRPS